MIVFPEPVMVPTVALPFWTLSTDQVTAVLVEPETAAVRERVLPVLRLAEAGLKETTMGAWTVTAEEALLLASAALVALTVCVPAAAGAV